MCQREEYRRNNAILNVPNAHPDFNARTGKWCTDYRTQITSGERFGFIVDVVSSDWRLSYGYGEVEPRWHNRGTETDSPLGYLSPSPSSGASSPSRGGRTPSRPASPKPPPPRRTPIRTGELIYSWGRRALHRGAQRRIHPMSTFSSPSLPPNRNSEYRTAPGRSGVRVHRGTRDYPRASLPRPKSGSGDDVPSKVLRCAPRAYSGRFEELFGSPCHSFSRASLWLARSPRPLGRRDRSIKEDFHSLGAGAGTSFLHGAFACASFLFRALFPVRASLPAGRRARGRKTCSPLNNHPYPPMIGSRFRILKNEERKMSPFVPHFSVFCFRFHF